MSNILRFIASLGIPQFITVLVNFMLVKYVDNDIYESYILTTNAALMGASVVISATNRLILTTRQEILSTHIFLFQGTLLTISTLVAAFAYKSYGFEAFLSCLISIAIVSYELMRTRLQKELSSQKFLIVSVIRSTSLFISIVFVISNDLGFFFLCGAFLTSYMIPNLISSRYRLHYKEQIKIDFKFIVSKLSLIIYSAVLPVISLLPIALYSRFSDDTLGLKVWVTAFSVYSIGNVVNAGLKKYLLAVFCKGKDRSDIRAVTGYLTVGLALMLLVLNVISFYLIPMLVGINKYEFTYTLAVLSISCIVTNIFSPYSEYLQSKIEYNYLILTACINLLVMIVVAYSLIPELSVIGLSVAFLISYFTQNLMIYLKYMRINQ